MENEEELVRDAQAGSLAAFDELVHRYRRALWLTVRPLLGSAEAADDVAQDALLLAYKALPSLDGPERFGAWIRAIARNRAMRVAEGDARTVAMERTALDELILRHSRHLSMPSDHRWIRDEVAELPEEYRQALALYYFEEWSVERISRFLGLPQTTLKWRLHQGRQLLRRRLGEAEENL